MMSENMAPKQQEEVNYVYEKPKSVCNIFALINEEFKRSAEVMILIMNLRLSFVLSFGHFHFHIRVAFKIVLLNMWASVLFQQASSLGILQTYIADQSLVCLRVCTKLSGSKSTSKSLINDNLQSNNCLKNLFGRLQKSPCCTNLWARLRTTGLKDKSCTEQNGSGSVIKVKN